MEVSERIAVIGAGYVGLTTALCLAELGHSVACADIDRDRVARLCAGQCPIHEPGLEDLLRRCLAEGAVTFVDDPTRAVGDADFVLLCVPTPQTASGAADLSHLEAAARGISRSLRDGVVVINKSTVPIGSTRFVDGVLGRPDVVVVSNPEFLREGSAIHDFLHPDRIIIGCVDPDVAARVAELYRGLAAPVLVTDPESAELVKYASNAFLAMKLTFANEIVRLCEEFEADSGDVLQGMGLDSRIGPGFLAPGPGWGGSCFPKDSRALVQMATRTAAGFPMLTAMLETNDSHFDRVVAKVERALDGPLDGARVAVWGLTFKANTDDRRESPALAVVRRLVAGGATVVAFDPTVPAGASIEECATVGSALDAVHDAHVLVVLTEWPEFATVDATAVAARLRGRTVVDARNLLDRGSYADAGLELIGQGR